MEVDNLPIIKVYDIDYSFIVKNYLNPEMWNKEWNIFAYKGFVFKLKIYSIECADKKIRFYVSLEDTLNHDDYWAEWDSYPYRAGFSLYYSLKIDDVKFLKNKIYSTMKSCIEQLERNKSKGLEEYQEMRDDKYSERRILEKIAEDFLDDNNVTNQEIRDVYIENYVDNNSHVETRMKEFVDNNKYRLLTDLYMILGNSQQDEQLLEEILEIDGDYENIYNEVKEYMVQLETEEGQEELKDNLEDI